MLAILAAALLASPPTTIDYARASSTLGAVHGTWEHMGAALFDGRTDTAWCVGVGGAGEGERIGVEFSAPVRIDKIRIALGDPKHYGGASPANRPAVLTLSNMSYVWQIQMPDDPAAFDMPLPPPITGRQLTIRLEKMHDHGGRHTCLAEITLYQDGSPIRLARTAEPAPRVEGIWVPIEAQSPERFVVFYRDGRLRVRDHPDWSGPMPDRMGRWSRKGGQLEVVLDGARRRFAIEIGAHADGRPRLRGADLLANTWVPWVPDPTFRSALW